MGGGGKVCGQLRALRSIARGTCPTSVAVYLLSLWLAALRAFCFAPASSSVYICSIFRLSNPRRWDAPGDTGCSVFLLYSPQHPLRGASYLVSPEFLGLKMTYSWFQGRALTTCARQPVWVKSGWGWKWMVPHPREAAREDICPKWWWRDVCMREEAALDSRKREEKPSYLLGVGS